MTSPTRRGFALLLVLVVLAAAALVVLMAITLGASEATQVSLEQHRERSLAVAEVGLERTTAYLDALLAESVDLDRALDPALDDLCGSPSIIDPAGDDHLPPFAEGTPVWLPDFAAQPQRFLRVPWPDAREPRGAYFVRVDDNDDDAGFGIPSATSNHRCVEKSEYVAVRDRDRVVVVTVVGISPGLEFASAHARKVLRVVVGRKEIAGVVAGGDVEIQGDACGRWCDLEAGGAIEAGRLCSDCRSGSECLPERVRAASRSGPCTRATSGPCLTQATLRPVPEVSPSSRAWRPGPCAGPNSCTPYFRVVPATRVSMWNYATAGCADPRRAAEDCSTGLCPCWRDVSAQLVSEGVVYVDGNDPKLRRSTPNPGRHTPDPDDPETWGRLQNRLFVPVDPGPTGCGPPGGLSYSPPSAPPPFPNGVWLLDAGRVWLAAPAGTPGCSDATLVVTGSVEVGRNQHAFRGSWDQDVALVVGGDLTVSARGSLTSCATGAVVLVREQVRVEGSSLLDAPVVAANAETCFFDVTGAALTVTPDSRLAVTATPLVSAPPLLTFAWSESSL